MLNTLSSFFLFKAHKTKENRLALLVSYSKRIHFNAIKCNKLSRMAWCNCFFSLLLFCVCFSSLLFSGTFLFVLVHGCLLRASVCCDAAFFARCFFYLLCVRVFNESTIIIVINILYIYLKLHTKKGSKTIAVIGESAGVEKHGDPMAYLGERARQKEMAKNRFYRGDKPILSFNTQL